MKLDKSIVQLSKKYQTPFLLIDPEKLKQNYKRIKASIDDAEVFYAIKANDHPRILKTLTEEGASFEITSLSELKSLLKLHVDSSKVICLNPVKSPDFLLEMYKEGITIMAFDSADEVDKIAKFAPKSQVVLRITVNKEGSDWPLTKKFGV